MTVGLNSNIKESDFQRKKLNLVIVMDISGSMSSSFNRYYYDGKQENNEDSKKSKMQIANESVNMLIDKLNPEDSFGMVLFETNAYIAKPLNPVANMNKEAIKKHVLEIEPLGGTNFEAGYRQANELMAMAKNTNPEEYENRIIVVTDAMPNTGKNDKEGLLSMVAENSEKGIYTTFIGVGVDFNSELIEVLSDTKGANYYSVHNAEEFESRMSEQFEYMVTPLVFDLTMSLNSSDFAIEKVYGSDKASKESGTLIKVNTLFPSKSSDTGEVKGGVVLLKLKRLSNNEQGNIKLSVSYKDRNGQEFSNTQDVSFNAASEGYENTGIRKAIALSRYANTIKNWILYERTEDNKFIIASVDGIVDADFTKEQIVYILGEHERPSQPLKVSAEYKQIFNRLENYLSAEISAIGDDSMNKEIEVLKSLQK